MMRRIEYAARAAALLIIASIAFFACMAYGYARPDDAEANADARDAAQKAAWQSVASDARHRLDALDISELQKAADALAGEGRFDVRAVLNRLMAGAGLDAQALMQGLLKMAVTLLKSRIPFMAALITGAALAGVADRLGGEHGAEISSASALCVAAGLVASDFAELAHVAREAMTAAGEAVNALLPLMSGIMAAMGTNMAGGMLCGLMSAAAGAGLEFGRKYIMGMIIVSAALEICAGLSSRVHIGGLAELMRTLSGIIVGAALVVTLGAVSINGNLGAGMNGISMRAAKYAVNNLVPVVGSEIKDTVEIMAASCLMVQNLLGICGMLLMITGMAYPVMLLAAAYISYKLCAAAVQALDGGRVGALCAGMAKVICALMVAVIGETAVMIMLLGAFNASARALI